MNEYVKVGEDSEEVGMLKAQVADLKAENAELRKLNEATSKAEGKGKTTGK